MARIDVEAVAHRYELDRGTEDPADWALASTSHRFRDGGAVAVLGPSGCGKTTLLSILSGLLQPTRGAVRIDGRDVTRLAPRERRVAQVFQFPVVYEAMTVFDNLAFPIRNDGLPEQAVRERVAEIADLLGLGALLGERPRRLSAAEQQTVSLGRGLVRSGLAALLLDEPLTVIDPARRWEIRRKLRIVHQRSNVTLVYVTHDQTEALTFADEVVVMDRGRILQVGSPTELFEDPKHAFVGHFIGSPGMNFLPCQVEGGHARVGEARIELLESRAAQAGAQLGIRPEFLEIAARPAPGRWPVRVDSVAEHGDHRLVTVRLGELPLVVRMPGDAPVPADDAYLHLPPRWIRLYDADGAGVS